MLASWHGFFDWYGWPALVALGTIGLAAATVWLGAQARKEVGDAWAREWAAQRPEVYPLIEHPWVRGSGRYEGHQRYVLPLKNGGRGPALNVEGRIVATTNDGTEYERDILAGSIAPGDVLDARVAPAGIEAWRTASGVLRYQDLARGAYESRFEFSEEGNELVVVTSPTTFERPKQSPP